MVKNFDDYNLLAGNHGMRGSIWQGPDHLLVVEGSGFITPFREQYKRIDYKNVQALTLVPTAKWIWITVLLAIPMGLFFCAAGYGLYTSNEVATVICGTFALVLLAWMIVHLSLGRTCRCAVQTAVQILRLKPLKREKASIKVLQALESICQLHQGEMPDAAALATISKSQPTVLTNVKTFWPGSAWVIWAGVCMLTWGTALAAEFFVQGPMLTVAGLAAGCAAFVVTLAALVRVYHHISPASLLVGLWGGFGLQMLAGLGLYIAFIAASMGAQFKKGVGFNETSGFHQISFSVSDMTMEQTEGLGWIAVGLGAGMILLALIILPHGFQRPMSENVESSPDPSNGAPPAS